MTEFIGAIIAAIIIALVKVLFEYIDEKQFEKDLIAPDEIEILKNDDEINSYIDYFEKNIGKPYNGCRTPRKTVVHKILCKVQASGNNKSYRATFTLSPK